MSIIDNSIWKARYSGVFSCDSDEDIDSSSVEYFCTDTRTVSVYLLNKSGNFYLEGDDDIARKTFNPAVFTVYCDGVEVDCSWQ